MWVKLWADSGVDSTVNFENMSRRYTSPFRSAGFEEHDLLELQAFQDAHTQVAAPKILERIDDEEKNSGKAQIHNIDNGIARGLARPAPPPTDTPNVAQVLKLQDLAGQSSFIMEDPPTPKVRYRV